MTLEITVHHFAKSTEKLSASVIDSAKTLVKTSALDSAAGAWRLATCTPVPCYVKIKKNFFLWTPLPPKVQCKHDASFLPDWDSDVSSPLISMSFYSTPLDEFESTDFTKAFKAISISKVASSIPRRRFAAELDTNSESGLYKRIRLPQPTGSTSFSIFQTIPLPHYLDVRYPSRPPPKEIDKIPDFPIFRCFVSSVQIRPSYVRTGWIIPLRGLGPVEDASGAQSSANSTPSCSNIVWNSPTLSQFWNFLLQQRIHHRLGPLSFGYIYSPPGTKQDYMNSRLLEYIKIYHDVQYAMKIRSVLNSFRCNDPSVLTGTIRIFKGKKLLLVDETCQPILLA